MDATSSPLPLPQLLRQALLFGLLIVTMILTASGVTQAIDEVLWTARPDNQRLARTLAMIALGAPGFSVALAVTVRRLDSERSWSDGVLWQLSLAFAATAALIGTMVGATGLLTSAIRTTSLDGHDVAMALTWGAFLVLFWMVLLPRFEPRGDLHFAAGSIVALVPLLIGQAGLLRVAGDRVTAALADRSAEDVRIASSTWGAMFIVATVVWIAIWLRRYESAPRTDAWHAVVVLVGTMVGFTAWLVSVARLGWLVAVWMFGDRFGQVAADRFDHAPLWVGIGLSGGVSFLYHRSLLGSVPARNEPLRFAEHLMLFAGLVAAATGFVVLASGVFDPDGVDVNLALGGVMTLLAGGLVAAWLIGSLHAIGNGPHAARERDSTVRKAYYLGVFGVGVIAALFAGIDALQGIFEDLLDGDATLRTLADRRGEIATVVVTLPILGLHQIARTRSPSAHTPAMAT